MRAGNKPRLVVVPSDPIAAYEAAGYDWLERYFNPQGMFQEVFALSPFEKGERQAHGMTVIGVPERNFAGKLRELRPDLVRAYDGFWASDLVCSRRVAGIPVVVSVHDTNPRLIHDSVRYADLVICMSNVVAQQVVERGTQPSRVRIMPNRVDGEVFHPIKDPAYLQPIAERFPAGKYLLHVGRKSEQKNLDTVIRMLSLLPAEYRCVFVGQGDPIPFQGLARELGVEERCFWVGSVKNSELPLWYSWCDCMCTPSRWEGFGIVFIEAAACGAPIVTSDLAPMNEYLTHEVSACLVKQYLDPPALAAAVRRVCEDRPYRDVLAQGAVQAAQPFARHLIDAQETAIYREAIGLGPLPLARSLEIAAWRLKNSVLGPVARMAGRLAKLPGQP
jgi:glycosyltransferase involved in cell wall biosynthesis